MRHLRGFAPVSGGSEHAGRPRQAAPSPPPSTPGPVPPRTYLRTVLTRLFDDGSRRKQRQTAATIATMKCYFTCSRLLIIIFSHQEDAPTGRARAAGAAGRWRRSWLGWHGLARWPSSACCALWPRLAERALPHCRLGGRFRIHGSLGHIACHSDNYNNIDAGGRPSICATWRLSSAPSDRSTGPGPHHRSRQMLGSLLSAQCPMPLLEGCPCHGVLLSLCPLTVLELGISHSGVE